MAEKPQEQIEALVAEVEHLRARLAEAPKRMRTLEERLLETKGQLSQAIARNEKLSYTLREARDHIATLREEVDKLTQPPSAYGVVVGKNEDGTVDVLTSGRKMKVTLHPEIDHLELEIGSEVVLNESFNVILARSPGDHRRGRHDQGSARGRRAGLGRRARRRGAHLRARRHRARHPPAHRRHDAPRPPHQPAAREAAPSRGRGPAARGGARTSPTRTSAGSTSRSSRSPTPSSCRSSTPTCSPSTACRRPKGILLYGPPGCGKTLIAKAVANSLARKVAAATGDEKGRSYFINIKGPELLNKYVGETERQIRMVFQRAREKSEEGWPVIVFFDEMDSMFRTRGTGVSSDMESTIVPQLLAEIDGVEGSAQRHRDRGDEPRGSHRPGDPATRTARREDQDRAPEQGGRRPDLRPLPHRRDPDRRRRVGRRDDHGDGRRDVQRGRANRFLEVTYANGDKEILYFKDFASGAMIENIVRRSKKLAIKRVIGGGAKGVATADLVASIKQEYKEHEDLPNTTNPDDWAKISGKKGERIVFIRTLTAAGQAEEPHGGRAIERVATGQYL